MSGKRREMTPKGQMSESKKSGPAIMMMPPHVRAMFMPDPPLKALPPTRRRRPVSYVDPNPQEGGSGIAVDEENRKQQQPASQRPKLKTRMTGLGAYVSHFERTPPPPREVGPTPKSVKESRSKKAATANESKLAPLVEQYRLDQRDAAGEFEGMNCYRTLFVGRLAYEATERRLLREFEAFGAVKDLRIVYDTSSQRGGGEKKSRGYAFVEYEREEDMKRAYRAADGLRIEGRAVVVDVERGHTVPKWLPRRLGGGLGGTRLGGKDKNVTTPGRYDPSKQPPPSQGPPPGQGPPMMGMGVGGMPPPGYGPPPGAMGRGGPPPSYGGGRGGDRYGPGPGGPYGGYRDGPPPPRGPPGGGGGGDYYGGGGRGGIGYDDRGRFGGGGGGHDDRHQRKRRRSRSRSPERRRGRY